MLGAIGEFFVPRSKSPWYRIRNGAMILGMMVLAAVVGYVALGWEWLDALYMVVITVGTIGFTDQPSSLSPAEKFLTIGVVILGVTVVAYIFAGFVQMITAGELQKALGQYRMSREIEQLEGHVIICGAGRTGRLLADELERGNRNLCHHRSANLSRSRQIMASTPWLSRAMPRKKKFCCVPECNGPRAWFRRCRTTRKMSLSH